MSELPKGLIRPDNGRSNWQGVISLFVITSTIIFSFIGVAYSLHLNGYRKLDAYIQHHPNEWDFIDFLSPYYYGSVTALLASVWAHRYRAIALLPIGSLSNFVGWAFTAPQVLHGGQSFIALMAIGCGLAIGVAFRAYFHFNAILRVMLASFVTISTLAIANDVSYDLFPLPNFEGAYSPAALPRLIVASAFVFFGSLVVCARPLFEFFVEVPTRVMYRIRAKGLGIPAFPTRGPVMVLANHAAYLDPLFLAADIPRPLTPMMTSKFYDRWFIYPIVKYLLGVIRVPEVAVRREAPELDLAVQALDAGKCLVIFPEGYLQRKPDQPLRRFGRGVWEILKARPETPVVAAWIEGNWGSYFSYFHGPPTKGKKPDLRRPISIGYTAPFTMPKELLDDHWATRFYLMNQVGGARALLGLPRIPEEKMPEKEERSGHGDSEGAPGESRL